MNQAISVLDGRTEVRPMKITPITASIEIVTDSVRAVQRARGVLDGAVARKYPKAIAIRFVSETLNRRALGREYDVIEEVAT